MSPSSMDCCTSWGSSPSTVQPVDFAVPRISLTVPLSSFAIDRGHDSRNFDDVVKADVAGMLDVLDLKNDVSESKLENRTQVSVKP